MDLSSYGRPIDKGWPKFSFDKKLNTDDDTPNKKEESSEMVFVIPKQGETLNVESKMTSTLTITNPEG